MADASATSPQDQAGSAHRMATQPSVVGLPWGQNGLSTRGHLSTLRTRPELPTGGPHPRAVGTWMGGLQTGAGRELRPPRAEFSHRAGLSDHLGFQLP